MSQAEKKLKKSEPSSQEWLLLKQELAQYDDWLRYIQYYPIDMDYISILAQELTDRDANTRAMILQELAEKHGVLTMKDLSRDALQETIKSQESRDDFFI
jgi:hypothetical protein